MLFYRKIKMFSVANLYESLPRFGNRHVTFPVRTGIPVRANYEAKKFRLNIVLVHWFSSLINYFSSVPERKPCFLNFRRHVLVTQMAWNKKFSTTIAREGLQLSASSQTPQMSFNSLLLVYSSSSEICKWHAWIKNLKYFLIILFTIIWDTTFNKCK